MTETAEATTSLNASGGGTDLSLRYILNVTLLEDLHSGTGATEGSLDAVQMRDRNGRPMITRSHLRGLLREVGFDLVRLGLVPMDDVNALFGRRGALGRGALNLTGLRAVDDNTVSLNWTSTARRLDDRGPREDTLRTREHVGAGTLLSGEFEVSRHGLGELLELCVKRLVALGSRRNRGSGRIMTGLDAHFARPVRLTMGAPHGSRPRLRLQLKARDALCIAATGTPENLIKTECFVRGQALQGAFVSWLLDRNQNAADLLQGPDAPAFLNGYPLPFVEREDELDQQVSESSKQPAGNAEDNHREPAMTASKEWLAKCDVLPIPLDCPSYKPRPQIAADWPWWAETEAEDETEIDRAAQKPKRPGDREFLFRKDETEAWQRFEPSIAVRMRNDTGEARRRDADKQQLFSQEEISEDTNFVADIEFPSKEAADVFATRFAAVLERGEWLRLGRGGSPVEVVASTWLEEKTATGPVDEADSIAVTLTSDLISRGDYFGFRTELDLNSFLDLAVNDKSVRDRLSSLPIGFKAFSDTVRVYGFNAVSGLPREPALAIRRGSRMRIDGPRDALTQLRDVLLESRALGERQLEGFGRFRVDILSSGNDVFSRFALVRGGLSADAKVASIERSYARAEVLAKKLGTGPSPTQWIALERRIQAARSHEEINGVLQDLANHAGRLAGKTWQGVKLNLLQDRNEVRQDGIENQNGRPFAERKREIVTALRFCIAKAKQQQRDVDRA